MELAKANDAEPLYYIFFFPSIFAPNLLDI